MRRLLFGLACALIGACSQSLVPTAPSTAEAQVITAKVVPMHHNIPATDPQGVVWWVCATQPRNYVDAQGRSTLEEDHYLQRTRCPETPIK